ncbi:MAG: TIGR03564 family F420-dependent LLM class oxidoreductase [Deltaproteobacteria bacterium]|nr:TIGR03564 family F420-dependent LLM class oxidoreductase [Deltaproteobacteria bacterium]
MKIGVSIGELGGASADVDGVIAQARRAEADGFASAWLANVFGFDAMTMGALCARETSRIEIGTAVVPTFPRHPTAMAQQAMTAQAIGRGRFTLGIGLSHQVVIETMLGLSFAKPYSHMKEYLEVLVPLMQTGSAMHQGREYRVAASLNVPGGQPCQILVAALAPKMLALTGTVADGTITWMTGPKTIREHTAPRLAEAAAAAGRSKPRVVVGLPVAITGDPAAARRTAAQKFGIYGSLPSYRAMLDREGAEGPADVVIAGDEAAVEAELARLADAGATDFFWAPCPVEGDGDAVPRTRAFLARLARA